MPTDRRRAVRVPLELSVRYSVQGEAFVESAALRDISCHGLFVCTASAPPPSGDIVKCSLILGEDEVLAVTGEVTRTAPSADAGQRGFGVRLHLLSVRQRAMIEALVESRAASTAAD